MGLFILEQGKLRVGILPMLVRIRWQGVKSGLQSSQDLAIDTNPLPTQGARFTPHYLPGPCRTLLLLCPRVIWAYQAKFYQ